MGAVAAQRTNLLKKKINIKQVSLKSLEAT